MSQESETYRQRADAGRLRSARDRSARHVGLNLRQQFDPIERHQAVEPLANHIAAVVAKAQAYRDDGLIGV